MTTKITRTREYTVNMGNYESLKIGASIEDDTGLTPEKLDETLDYVLADEIKEARELTGTKDSFILSYRVSNA